MRYWSFWRFDLLLLLLVLCEFDEDSKITLAKPGLPARPSRLSQILHFCYDSSQKVGQFLLGLLLLASFFASLYWFLTRP